MSCKDHVVKLQDVYSKNAKADKCKKTSNLMRIIKKFIENNELILYGGLALDEILPEKKKIYGENTINDYDCYCLDSKRSAKMLADTLVNNGYKYVEMKESVNNSTTIKMYVEFIPACDFTEIDKDKFAMYKKLAVRKKGMLMSSPLMIKEAITLELCQPHLSYYRWDKMLDRFLILLSVYRDGDEKGVKEIVLEDKHVKDILNGLMKKIKDEGIPLIGYVGFKLLNNTGVSSSMYSILDPKMSYVSVICKHEELSKLEKVFGKDVKKVQNVDGTISYMYNDIYLLDVYNVENRCISVCKRSGYNVVNIFGIMYFLYGDSIKYNDGKDIKKLLYLCNKLLKKIDCKDKCYLGLECYGNFKSFLEVKKDRWNDKKIVYRPIKQSKGKSIFS